MPRVLAPEIQEGFWPQMVWWAQLWGLSGLAEDVSVEFSRRFRTSLGRCWPAQGRIRLGAFLLDGDPALLEEVLCHELAHVAAFRLHGRRIRPHGPEWKALLVKAGFEPRVRLQAGDVRLPKPAARARYEHRCPVCQAVRMAGRSVPQWRCSMCWKAGRSGKLVITRIPPS